MCQQCPACYSVMTQQGVYMICPSASCEVKVVATTVKQDKRDEKAIGDVPHVSKEFLESHKHSTR